MDTLIATSNRNNPSVGSAFYSLIIESLLQKVKNSKTRFFVVVSSPSLVLGGLPSYYFGQQQIFCLSNRILMTIQIKSFLIK